MLGIYCRTSRESATPVSTIEQQKNAGIKFAFDRKFDYKIYADEGISGYTIDEDAEDLFKNRPEFSRLLDDIKHQKIDSVWVWEHSRLSRNMMASTYIFQQFKKSNITVYEKDSEFKFDDPDAKMMRGVLDVIAEYERSMIVGRTTRGLHNAIDNGNRGYPIFYGYKKAGKDNSGRMKWEPVESELNNLEFAYQKVKEGWTLHQVCLELYNNKIINTSERIRLSTKWTRFLRHFEYTGYALNREGLSVLHKFEKNEINDISVINNPKYYIKSVPYPRAIVSIDDWITVMNKLQRYKVRYINNRKLRTISASKDMATGIIQCATCKLKYYYYPTPVILKTGERQVYYYYKHMGTMDNKSCKQHPKTIKTDRVNDFFKLYYFYYYLVFDDTASLVQETQRRITQDQITTKERIQQMKEEITKSEKNIKKFNGALDGAEDKKTIRVLAERISHEEDEKEKNSALLASLIVELDKLEESYHSNELEMTFYDVKEKVVDFFEKYDIDTQRKELLRIIDKCLLYGKYLIIVSKRMIFLFDTRSSFKVDEQMFANFKNDANFKLNFLHPGFNYKELKETTSEAYEVKSDYFYSHDMKKNSMNELNLNDTIDKILLREQVSNWFIELGINYDLADIDKVIHFVKDWPNWLKEYMYICQFKYMVAKEFV
jgi:DNA invertase Pin-like site-specific DNA recombinase